MNKNIFVIALIILSLFVFVSCQSTEPNETKETEPVEAVEEETTEEATEEATIEEETTENMMELTLEELSAFNGKDGERSYVAVEGVIYDVTDVDAWQNGMHNGVEAGKDLTDEIMNQSPHGTSTLGKAVKVGKLVE
jgi:predicted heme/steroid binding protein